MHTTQEESTLDWSNEFIVDNRVENGTIMNNWQLHQKRIRHVFATIFETFGRSEFRQNIFPAFLRGATTFRITTISIVDLIVALNEMYVLDMLNFVIVVKNEYDRIFLKYFIRLITSYNWSFIIQREWLLYPTTSYKHFITCCNPITNCFIIKHFFFSRYRKHFISDVILAATFQGCRVDILVTRW